MYKVNDYLVYGKDVCKVEKIEKNKFNNEDYYLLRPIKNKSLKISAPIKDKAGKIRPLITKEKITVLINQIPNIPLIETEDKFIESEYKKLLYTNSHENLIKIIKTAYIRNKKRLDNNKKISEKDKTYFELAEELLYNEFATVLRKSMEETKLYIINKITENENKNR